MSKEIARSVEGMSSDVRAAVSEAAQRSDLPKSEWLRHAEAELAWRAGDAFVQQQATRAKDLPDAARMSDADQARREAGAPDDHDGRLRGNAETAGSNGLDDGAAGHGDEETLLAAAIEALEQRAAANRHQAADVLAAVNTLMSTCETRRDSEWETFADLSQKLDDLETRLRERGGAEADDAFLKSALKAVEAGLWAFARRRTQAAAPAQSTETAKASLAESTAPAQSAASQNPALGPLLQASFPFRSDLLSRLNAAMPADASAPIGGRNDFAELARKLDEMCRGVSPSRAHGGETIHGGGFGIRDADAPPLSGALADAGIPGGETASETPAEDMSAGAETGRDAGVADKFDRLARDGRLPNEENDRLSTFESLPRASETSRLAFDSPNHPGADSAAFARMQAQMAEIRDLMAAVATRPPPIDKLERQVALLTESLVGQGSEGALGESGGLGRPSALQAIEARLDALTRVSEEAVAKGNDRAQYDALSEQIEATHSQFAARLDAGLAAASAETSALKGMVGALAERMEAVQDPKSADLAIEALEREMAKVAERLDGADKAFASLTSLEHSIAALFEQLEETRRTALEAVAAAERSGARDFAPLVSFGKAGARDATGDLGQSVTSEIAELRAAQDAADRRVDLTLTALRETVDKVADRLVKVEADLGAMRPARLGSLLAPNLTPIFTQGAERRADDPDKTRSAAPTPVFAADALRPVLKLSFESKPDLDAKSIDAADVLLEPGSGFPQRREKSEQSRVGALAAISNDLEGHAVRRGDFIAAARRAAQAAQNDSLDPAQDLPGPDVGADPEPRSGLLNRAWHFFGGRKRPVILSLAALLLAASAYALARTVVHTATIDDLSPALLKQLGKGLVHGKAPPPAADKAAARERPAAAVSTAQPQATPGLLDSSQLAPPQSLSNPPVGPAQADMDAPARKAIAGSAPIMIGALERVDASRQIAPAPLSEGPPPPASEPFSLGGDPREQAEAGNAMAQFELGMRFAEGRDRPRDLKLAVQWYEKAARHGLAKAQYRLATLYEKGLGAPRDFARAVTLYLAAAEQGNTRAMHNLGVLAADNPDGRPDYATAALWFAKAAESGVRDSQFNLAVLLARGLGTPQDLVKAYAWFAIVAAQGDAEAAKKRDEISARLAAADLTAAQTAANAFRPRLADQTANEAPEPQSGSDAPASGAAANAPKVSGL